MKRHQNLTFKEHVALGRQLYAMRQVIFGRAMRKVCRTRGTSSKPNKVVDRLCSVLDKLRCEMDNQLCRDYPDKFDVHVYYPGQQELSGRAR